MRRKARYTLRHARCDCGRHYRLGARILLREDPGVPFVRAGEQVYPFQLDDFSRWRLLEGLDDIGLTLRHEDLIGAYEEVRPDWMPAVI